MNNNCSLAGACHCLGNPASFSGFPAFCILILIDVLLHAQQYQLSWMEQGPDFWRWFDTTQFSYHCVHPIHAKMFSIQMLLHFSQIVQRVCTLVLFIIMASLLSGVIRSLLCKPRAFSPAITISRAFIRRAPVQSIIIRRNYTRLHEHAHLIHVHVYLH